MPLCRPAPRLTMVRMTNTPDNARPAGLTVDLRTPVAERQAVAVVGSGGAAAATGNAPAPSWSGLPESGVARSEQVSGIFRAGWGRRRRDQPLPEPRGQDRPGVGALGDRSPDAGQAGSFVHTGFPVVCRRLVPLSQATTDKARALVALVERPAFRVGRLPERRPDPLMLTILCLANPDGSDLPRCRAGRHSRPSSSRDHAPARSREPGRCAPGRPRPLSDVAAGQRRPCAPWAGRAGRRAQAAVFNTGGPGGANFDGLAEESAARAVTAWNDMTKIKVAWRDGGRLQ